MRGICLLAIGFAAATSGCGDGKGSTGTGGTGGGGGTGGSGASCAGRNTACGGDVVGTWAIAEVCNLTLTTPGSPLCPGTDYSQSTLTETGTFTFRADGTATEDLTATGTLREAVPASCLDVLGTCADLDANFKMAVQDGLYTSGSCATGAADSCDCMGTFQVTATISGTYTKSGSTLTLMNTSNNSTTSSYCVQGSTMVISVPSTTGGQPAIYVLTKQ